MFNWGKSRVSLLLIIAFLSLMQSCAIFESPESKLSSSPGNLLITQYKAYKHLSNEQIKAFIPQSRVFEGTRLLALQNIDITNHLIAHLSVSKNPDTFKDYLHNQATEKRATIVGLAMGLFPLEKFTILRQVNTEEFSEDFKSAFKLTKLDPKLFLLEKTSPVANIEIVPLIHSATVRLQGIKASKAIKIDFRPLHSDEWRRGYPLRHDPVSGSYSTSLVNLDANSSYEVRFHFELSDTFSNKKSNKIPNKIPAISSFKTRATQIHVKPKNTILLSDIYEGGDLDLSQVTFKREEGEWIKIIGDVPVIANEQADAALFLGSQSHIILKNITVKGGKRYGISANEAHHIWIDGCDISDFGREASVVIKGQSYASTKDDKPINYDAGIFLIKSGVVTIENCKIHSPRVAANHWGHGHPRGASAMLISANHPDKKLQGQYIIRNNHFYGAPDQRFNDVIETRANVRPLGGFIRDSAIYGNLLEYANDDLLELDGSQANILVYDNVLRQGYCGISLAPNMRGPNFIFNNSIVDLGDERGSHWAAFKMGGLFSAPAGQSHIFQNYIDVNSNGIATGGIRGDSTFWVNTKHNIFVLNHFRSSKRGYAIFDRSEFSLNEYMQDLVINHKSKKRMYFSESLESREVPLGINNAMLANEEDTNPKILKIEKQELIPNFSERALIKSPLKNSEQKDIQKLLVGAYQAQKEN
uniref:right-handed parallel beta-helix repeat-containing protein n=1 Tax=Ningiella ruwaisensis TaxID=2364274 RepID=UPI0010A02C8A|nr:right-handed parallel beta-helix repeat-containing protein [Ningiella ruwaisensis]